MILPVILATIEISLLDQNESIYEIVLDGNKPFTRLLSPCGDAKKKKSKKKPAWESNP